MSRSRSSSRSSSRTSLRSESARSRALSPRPNRIVPAEVHVVDELVGKSPSSSPRDAQAYRPGSRDGRPSSRVSPRPGDDRAASATSQSSSKKGLLGKFVGTFGGKTSVMSMRAAAPGESVSNPRTPSKNSGRRPSTGMSMVSAVSSSSGCSSSSQRSDQAEVHFEVPLDKRFECPACQQVLRFPVEFQECGHHVCSQCIPELVRTSGACPIDNKAISRDQAYPNKSLQLEIAALAVRCSNAVRGCVWRGRYDEHQLRNRTFSENNCNNMHVRNMAEVAAPQLPGEVQPTDGNVGGGTKTVPPSQSVDRPDSGNGSSTHGSQTSVGSGSQKGDRIPGKKAGEDGGSAVDSQSVGEEKNGTKEPRSGKAKDKTKGAESHDESCEHATEVCPNGCGADVQKRFLQSHLNNDCPKRGTACDFCGQNVQQEDEIEHLKVCDKFPMSCPNGCDAKELPREELVYHSAQECPKAVIPCPFRDACCPFEAERQHMMVHLEGSIVEHLEKTVTLSMENARRLTNHAEKLIDNTVAVQAMQGSAGSMDKGCQLLWKITSYNEKLADARAGRRVSLYSPMFLSSRYGYKMAISICPNGDGQGKGKYMSLFMCIIKGEFDALLPWPFAQKVTITVIDQCQDPAARKNIEYVMKPNTCKDNLQFLGRPLHERNPSFGTQMFCPLSQLARGDYIRDNTMFISVQVDNSKMPSIP
ncbi:TNF receptor-associated factor 4-like [Branchiostoma lanceolatum]|uniref:TNF receptor-associated factor 4-like n=1 Tax=Branchiostoma lanceolatum TaxID=7740 RepID=UPI0034525417